MAAVVRSSLAFGFILLKLIGLNFSRFENPRTKEHFCIGETGRDNLFLPWRRQEKSGNGEKKKQFYRTSTDLDARLSLLGGEGNGHAKTLERVNPPSLKLRRTGPLSLKLWRRAGITIASTTAATVYVR